MEEYLEEDIAQLFEHLAFRFAVAHGRGEFGRLLLKIRQERGMGLLALPLPNAPRRGHGLARLHDGIRKGFGANDGLAASEAGASFRIVFVGADQGSGGVLAYQQIGEIPPYGHGYLTREVDRATQLPVRLHGDHGGPAFIEQQHSHVHKV